MTRSPVLPLLLISVAVGGFLFVRDTQTSGPTSTVARHCLQSGPEHLAGPGGTAQPGPC